MEIIIGAIVFGLIIIAIIVMVVINFTYRGVKKMREQMDDDRYRQMKEKEQKEKHPFGKDYFKSAAPKKQQAPRPSNKSQEEKPKQQERPKPQEQARQQTAEQDFQKETARRTVTTDSNVTIIDDRQTGDKRKIFDDKDGEYVEFEEV
jgi:FtsZ-interacting cell division protein ZipA